MSLSNIIFLQLLDALHLNHSPPSCELPMTSFEAEEYWVKAFRNAPWSYSFNIISHLEQYNGLTVGIINACRYIHVLVYMFCAICKVAQF